VGQAIRVARHRCLQLPKHGNSAEEFEDAFACNEQAGKFAIADGASESICAGEWARLLCEAYVAGTSNGAEIGSWLPGAQKRWRKLVADQPADWHVQEKLRDGAFSTLLGIQIETTGESAGRWRALAIGDSCLFLVRGDALRGSFPIERAADFGTRPNLIGSRQREHLRASVVSGTLHPGDHLLLMTDALAEWFHARTEAGAKPWQELEELTSIRFPDWVSKRRSDHSLKNDDVTMVVIETA